MAASGAAWSLVKATQDYDAKADNHLSFKAGAVIEVKEISEKLEFFDGKLDGQQGLVPRSHVEKHDTNLASTADANLTLAEKLEQTRSELAVTKQELSATKEDLETAKTKISTLESSFRSLNQRMDVLMLAVKANRRGSPKSSPKFFPKKTSVKATDPKAEASQSQSEPATDPKDTVDTKDATSQPTKSVQAPDLPEAATTQDSGNAKPQEAAEPAPLDTSKPTDTSKSKSKSKTPEDSSSGSSTTTSSTTDSGSSSTSDEPPTCAADMMVEAAANKKKNDPKATSAKFNITRFSGHFDPKNPGELVDWTKKFNGSVSRVRSALQRDEVVLPASGAFILSQRLQTYFRVARHNHNDSPKRSKGRKNSTKVTRGRRHSPRKKRTSRRHKSDERTVELDALKAEKDTDKAEGRKDSTAKLEKPKDADAATDEMTELEKDKGQKKQLKVKAKSAMELGVKTDVLAATEPESASQPLSQTKVTVKLYRALYDYKARNTREMTFTKGQELEAEPVKSKGWDDWLAARPVGQAKWAGIVPRTYLAEIIEDDANGKMPFMPKRRSASMDLARAGIGAKKSSERDISQRRHTTTHRHVLLKRKSSGSASLKQQEKKPIYVMAKFDYKNKAGGTLKHLSFKAGDVIRVEKYSSTMPWLQGTLKGQKGLLPTNHVELVDRSPHTSPLLATTFRAAAAVASAASKKISVGSPISAKGSFAEGIQEHHPESLQAEKPPIAEAKTYLLSLPRSEPKFKGPPKADLSTPGMLDKCFPSFEGLLQKQPSVSKRINVYRFKACFLLYYDRHQDGTWSVCAGGYDLRQITNVAVSTRNDDLVYVEFGKNIKNIKLKVMQGKSSLRFRTAFLLRFQYIKECMK